MEVDLIDVLLAQLREEKELVERVILVDGGGGPADTWSGSTVHVYGEAGSDEDALRSDVVNGLIGTSANWGGRGPLGGGTIVAYRSCCYG